MTQYFKNLGEQLLDQGYLIVPLPPGSKGPRIKGWPNLKLDKPTFHKMAANGSADAGIGVLARYTPAIDVDILDERAAQEMSDLIDEIFAGQALMTRTGRAPKFLIPFRSDDPFKKLTSNVYTDGENDHKVEILGDGQQWVAYHIHPETLRPYDWWDGLADDGIRSTARESLPCLSRSNAQRVIDAFEVLAGGMVASGRWSKKGEVAARDDRAPSGDDPFASHVEPVGKSYREVEALLAQIPNDDLDYEKGWFPVLCAIHHELGDEGRDIAYGWSSSSGKHTDARFDTSWNSLGHYTGRQVTLRSLLKGRGVAVPAEHKPRATTSNPFAVHAWGDYKQNYLSTPWIVKGVLPQAEVGILYGQSGSGKTFFVLDLAATIARGGQWRGRKVSDCRVVYVAAEAREGVKKRMDAYDQYVCAEGARPDIIASAPNLLSSDTQQLAAAIGRAGLIILDTMAASHSGDENSAKDMGMFLAACKELSETTGAMVLAVHHTGKEDSKGMRGSSALFAGADFVMEVFKNDKEHGAVLSKSRDDATGASFSFVLKRVAVGHDDEGDEVTTCVVEPIKKDVEKGGKRPAKLANLSDSRYDLSREVLAIVEDLAHDSNTGKVHQDKIFEVLLDKYPGKQKKNMAVVLLRLEQMGAIKQSLDCYSVDDSDDFLG